MALRKNGYLERLIDKKIEDYLSVFGAVLIEGSRFCGKTWTSLNHAKSVVYMDNSETKEKAMLSLDYVLNEEAPELIDEWNLVPEIWDAVRRKCDETTKKGNYILTCSTKLKDDIKKKKIMHSGTGRIGKIKMYSMSLYESGDSTGKASIMDMYNNKQENCKNPKITLDEIAKFIVRGGWPSNIKTPEDKIGIIPRSYIDTILDTDIHDEN